MNAENHKPNPIFAHFSWDERERLLRSGGSALAGPVAMRAELAVVRQHMHAIHAPQGWRLLQCRAWAPTSMASLRSGHGGTSSSGNWARLHAGGQQLQACGARLHAGGRRLHAGGA